VKSFKSIFSSKKDIKPVKKVFENKEGRYRPKKGVKKIKIKEE